MALQSPRPSDLARDDDKLTPSATWKPLKPRGGVTVIPSGLSAIDEVTRTDATEHDSPFESPFIHTLVAGLVAGRRDSDYARAISDQFEAPEPD